MSVETAPTYPVKVNARLDRPLSRWLWLVKWAAAIPHYVILAFLWLAFVVLSVGAFFAVAFTGRYPRAIFEFNLGVLRWTWRVQYYTYGALGTDRYPPFTLAEVPDYPARLDVPYPDRLSRGLVLVKWWLLAIPHYLIVGLLVSGTGWLALRAGSDDGTWLGGGLIGLLVFIAGVALLFTGRYPQSLFDLVLGLNRWVLRVAAYAALMTDDYPPFRLDLGGSEPGETSQPHAAPAASDVPVAVGAPPAASGWTAGRIVSMVAGSVALLLSLGLFAAGGAALWFDQNRDDGYLTSARQTYVSTGYAITTERIDLGDPGWTANWQFDALGTLRLRAVSTISDAPLFLGIGPSREVAAYLRGVAYTELHEFGHHGGIVRRAGGAPAGLPAAQYFWAAHSTGTGERTVTWPASAGSWTVVAMNADASPGLSIRADAGATAPVLPWVAGGLLIVAGLLLAGGLVLVVVPVHRAR